MSTVLKILSILALLAVSVACSDPVTEAPPAVTFAPPYPDARCYGDTNRASCEGACYHGVSDRTCHFSSGPAAANSGAADYTTNRSAAHS